MGFNKFGGGRSFGGGDRGDRGGFGGGRSFGARSSAPRQMHQATCSKCGQDCEVPFRPTGDRPVFCSNCFKTEGGADRTPRFAPKSFGGGAAAPMQAGSSVSKEQFEMLNHKLDKILSLLNPVKPAKLEEKVKPDTVEMKVEKIEIKKAKTLPKKAKSKKK